MTVGTVAVNLHKSVPDISKSEIYRIWGIWQVLPVYADRVRQKHDNSSPDLPFFEGSCDVVKLDIVIVCDFAMAGARVEGQSVGNKLPLGRRQESGIFRTVWKDKPNNE